MTETDAGPSLPRAFFERETVDVAMGLIGCHLVSDLGGERTAGWIVETEAYRGTDDLASHAARLRTGRVLSMSGPAGFAYVYRSYGIHAMLNVVAHQPGETGAVLIRAIEPFHGLDTMRVRRGSRADTGLCSGPGKLCIAFGIGLDDHGIDLSASNLLRIMAGDPMRRRPILAGSRIGISKATDLPWRFFEADNPFVSAHRRGVALGGGGDIIS